MIPNSFSPFSALDYDGIQVILASGQARPIQIIVVHCCEYQLLAFILADTALTSLELRRFVKWDE